MADALLLISQKVVPAKVVSSGYKFLHAELEDALMWALRKNPSLSAGK
jgi:NAD dependent epimerase/dehydratase family enzyme